MSVWILKYTGCVEGVEFCMSREFALARRAVMKKTHCNFTCVLFRGEVIEISED